MKNCPNILFSYIKQKRKYSIHSNNFIHITHDVVVIEQTGINKKKYLFFLN